MSTDKALHVAYAADDRYAKYLGISLLSLLETNTAFESISCYVLDCGIGGENRKRLEEIAGAHTCQIQFVPVESIEQKLNLQGAAFTIAVASYARLFLPSLLPEPVEKLLYLDCDTIVADSLLDMWNTKLDNAYIAGVQDTVDSFFQKVIGLSPELPYINAGVLLINLKRWREDGLEARFGEFIRRFNGQVPHHDQGTINGVCAEKRVLLPLRYNMTSNLYSFSTHTIERIYFLKKYYSQSELDAALQSPGIVHFTSGLVGRPWEEGCEHPERGRYLNAAHQTPWGNEPLQPRTLAFKTRAFTFYYKHVPRGLFEASYRLLGNLQHLGK